jgi:hypothetical protein
MPDRHEPPGDQVRATLAILALLALINITFVALAIALR